MVQHLSVRKLFNILVTLKIYTIKVYVNGNFDGVTFPDSFKVFGPTILK